MNIASVYTQSRSYLPPGLQAWTETLPGASARTSDDERTPKPPGAPVALLGSDRLELSERGIELLGAAKGLPGERSPEEETATLGPTPGSTPRSGDRAEDGDEQAGPAASGSVSPGGAAETIGNGSVKAGGQAHEAGQVGAPARELEAEEGSGEEAEESKKPSGAELEPKEQAEVERLKERDREVRTHEHAHSAAGGRYVRGGISYEYERGPDGKSYAVGGEVSLDTSPVSGDPQATILKAQTIRRAAMAPAQPSGQDRSVAAAASRMEAQARQELLEEQSGNLTEGGDEAVAKTEDASSSTAEDPAAAANGELAASGGSGAAQATDSPDTDDEKGGSAAAGLFESSMGAAGESGGVPVASAMVEPPSAGSGGVEGSLTQTAPGAVAGPSSTGVADDEDDEGAVQRSAPPASPPQMRLDYGPMIQTGQLFDVTR